MGRPADVAILRECLNRDHVVNPLHASSCSPLPPSPSSFIPYTIARSFRTSRVHIRWYTYAYLHVRHRFLLSLPVSAPPLAKNSSSSIGVATPRLTRGIDERARGRVSLRGKRTIVARIVLHINDTYRPMPTRKGINTRTWRVNVSSLDGDMYSLHAYESRACTHGRD